jgi:hypothetical protein
VHNEGPKVIPRSKYAHMLIPQEIRTETQAAPIEPICISCQSYYKERGVDEVTAVDTNLKWTISENRSLYLEFVPTCSNYGYAGRFVLKNPDIPLIYAQTLSRLGSIYGVYDRCIIAKLMDC